jgi:hypothetical protein
MTDFYSRFLDVSFARPLLVSFLPISHRSISLSAPSHNSRCSSEPPFLQTRPLRHFTLPYSLSLARLPLLPSSTNPLVFDSSVIPDHSSPLDLSLLIFPTSTMLIPSLPNELYRHIVFFTGLDRPLLCTLCLVNSDIRSYAIRHLYAKLTFRSWEKLEACFTGRSGRREEETAFARDDERAWKETGQGKVMDRRARELKHLKELELDIHEASRLGPLRVPPQLARGRPFLVDILRLANDNSTLLPLLRIFLPRRLITNNTELSALLGSLSLSPDRPMILDTLDPESVQPLLSPPLNSISTILVTFDYYSWADMGRPILRTLTACSARIRIVTSYQDEGLAAELERMGHEGLLEGKDIQVFVRKGSRLGWNKDGEGRYSIANWRDELVDDFLED